MKRRIIIILIIGSLFCLSTLQSGLLLFTMQQSALAQDEESLSDSKYQIRLKSRVFTPSPNKDIKTFTNMLNSMKNAATLSVLPSDTMHFLIQFETLPDASEKKKLEAQGIRLIAYVTGNAYIASTNVSKLESFSAAATSLSETNTRWIGALEAEDKISEALKKGDIGSWATTADGRVILTVQFHSDVNLEDAENLLKALGGEILSTVPTVSSINVVFDVNKVNNIAAEDSVQYVDIVEPPLGEHNDGARNAANVAPLANVPYNLTGAGVTVLVYDSGIVDTTHPDFGARIIQTDPDPTETTRDHSTHVAGTVGGSGINSNGNDSAGNPNGGTANQWAGMAPGVNIRSFGSTGNAAAFYDGNGGDLNADFTTAITNGIDLATMSLGNNVYQLNPPPCAQLGDYSNTAILIDNIVTGSINNQQLIYFESAGNERSGGPPPVCSMFSSIGSPATAKNSIAVGAINSNNNTLTGFTSLGPTDDGRLKPDITAPGCQSNGDLGITSPSFIDQDPDGPGPLRPNGNLDPGEVQNAYVVKCGTSMATPVVAGSTALLIEQWRSTRGTGATPLPHTVKAILVHTSTDLGNPGPDYSFGWGALDAQAAVDLVIADDTAALIHVDEVNVGQTDFYTFNSSGSGNVKVTLAWDDPSATRLAATTLINDLDLRLTDPDGIVYQPFILNPANPANAATNGNDATNNVEMVIGNAKAGTWTVSVAGTTVPQGPQQYTLITPEDAAVNQPPVCNADGPYNAECQGTTTTLALDGTGSSDPDAGDTLTYAWTTSCPGGSFDDSTSSTPQLTVNSSSGTTVVCDAGLTVTDNDGAFDSCSSTVTIEDKTPPDIQCNAQATIIPPDAPISFTATATDICISDPSVEIIGYDCFKFTKKGKRIDKTESCVVEVNGDTVTIVDSGGVDDNITWTVRATDNSGNVSESTCSVVVVNPGQP